jgi:hypothetical protein
LIVLAQIIYYAERQGPQLLTTRVGSIDEMSCEFSMSCGVIDDVDGQGLFGHADEAFGAAKLQR